MHLFLSFKAPVGPLKQPDYRWHAADRGHELTGPDDHERLETAANAIRSLSIAAIHRAGSGHPGGSLSAADIVATLYFGGVLRHDPANPTLLDRQALHASGLSFIHPITKQAMTFEAPLPADLAAFMQRATHGTD